jgi:hypothetical protein
MAAEEATGGRRANADRTGPRSKEVPRGVGRETELGWGAEAPSPRPGPAPDLDPLPNQARHAPLLRANPYPEVTDLICRLPLPTLFYRLEATHLGDLLRIWVRAGRVHPRGPLPDFQGPRG